MAIKRPKSSPATRVDLLIREQPTETSAVLSFGCFVRGHRVTKFSFAGYLGFHPPMALYLSPLCPPGVLQLFGFRHLHVGLNSAEPPRSVVCRYD
ncbi:hypothetical protein Mapa_006310 [Marchantia paleacea]|nr:hypothetical protein Mapa_006310 [Marchantia paleacea]